MLKRAPIFLRVAIEGPNCDALDQIDDQPREGETLFAYRIEGTPAMCHIRASGGRGGFYPIANYRLIEQQPTQATMRDFNLWEEWCKRKAIE